MIGEESSSSQKNSNLKIWKEREKEEKTLGRPD
jgi:hypothetical protein